MRKQISLLTIVLTIGCADEPAELTKKAAGRRLLEHAVEASEGIYADSAAPPFTLLRIGTGTVRAQSREGEPLGSFRWKGDGWSLEPAPGWTARLRKLVHDRSQVEALANLVDSAEGGLDGFERQLERLIVTERGSDPWAWQLEQAVAYLQEMTEYLRTLRVKGSRLAGSESVLVRISGLRERLESHEARVNDALALAGRR